MNRLANFLIIFIIAGVFSQFILESQQDIPRTFMPTMGFCLRPQSASERETKKYLTKKTVGPARLRDIFTINPMSIFATSIGDSDDARIVQNACRENEIGLDVTRITLPSGEVIANIKVFVGSSSDTDWILPVGGKMTQWCRLFALGGGVRGRLTYTRYACLKWRLAWDTRKNDWNLAECECDFHFYLSGGKLGAKFASGSFKHRHIPILEEERWLQNREVEGQI